MTNKLSLEQIQEWHKICPIHVHRTIRESVRFLEGKESLRLIDIGSNVGVFGELLSGHIKIENAILFEPVKEMYEYCRANHPEWKHHNLVASDNDGLIKFNVEFGENLGTSRVVKHNAPTVRECRSVHIGNFLRNNYCNFNPHLIKIDAEGHDVTIMFSLLEYVKTLNDVVLVFEVSGSDDYSIVEEEYRKLGFNVWRSSPKNHSGDVWIYKEI